MPSLYAATVPGFLQILPSISALCDKGADWCSQQGLPDAELTQARLADDMWPFAAQIRSTWLHSADAIDAIRVGQISPDFSEPPTEFDGLKARVDDAIRRLEAVDPDQLDRMVGQDMQFVIGERSLDFTAEDYLLTFAVPNFYFHATTAYAILRARGLPIGKRDFLGQIRTKG